MKLELAANQKSSLSQQGTETLSRIHLHFCFFSKAPNIYLNPLVTYPLNGFLNHHIGYLIPTPWFPQEIKSAL